MGGLGSLVGRAVEVETRRVRDCVSFSVLTTRSYILRVNVSGAPLIEFCASYNFVNTVGLDRTIAIMSIRGLLRPSDQKDVYVGVPSESRVYAPRVETVMEGALLNPRSLRPEDR